MRRRRAETFAESVGELIMQNTYGGTKDGPRETMRQEMPIILSEAGIKMKWDNRVGKYPTMIELKMTDNEWVKYRIHIEQPAPQMTRKQNDLATEKRGFARRKR